MSTKKGPELKSQKSTIRGSVVREKSVDDELSRMRTQKARISNTTLKSMGSERRMSVSPSKSIRS